MQRGGSFRPYIYLCVRKASGRTLEEVAKRPKTQETHQRWRIFCSRLRRRMRFLRHFQRILPRFFHAREPRFMGDGPA